MATPAFGHLKSATDLMTPYAAIRAGFVQMALEKSRKANPLIADARAIKVRACAAATASQLLQMPEIRTAMLTASGLSDKAAGHLEEADKQTAMLGLVRNFLDPAGDQFVEELVFRFLLTKGDTLGGSMRNIAGALAQRKLSRAIISSLRLANQQYYWLHSKTKSWAPAQAEDADIEIHLNGLSWRRGKRPRTILYNITVPLIKNNIDLCLFDCDHQAISRDTCKSPESYLDLGELKGGIDPAGADEHWKTARTALLRIEAGFAKINPRPKYFFIAAAIEAKMAAEIWQMLSGNQLDNAANLTNDRQLDAIAKWLCML